MSLAPTPRAPLPIVFGGAAARYPDVRMIWAHGGGTMPFLVERFALMAQSAQNAPRFPQGFADAASKFFYDTAFVSNEAALLALRRVVPLYANILQEQVSLPQLRGKRERDERMRGIQCAGDAPDQSRERRTTISTLPSLARYCRTWHRRCGRRGQTTRTRRGQLVNAFAHLWPLMRLFSRSIQPRKQLLRDRNRGC